TAQDVGSADAASNFMATIDWGDSTTTSGTITGAAGDYTISGTHSYAEEGPVTAIVTFAEVTDPSSLVSTSIELNVSEGDVLTAAATQPTVSATEGQTFNGAVGTFTNSGYPGNAAGDFTASIDWGDG